MLVVLAIAAATVAVAAVAVSLRLARSRRQLQRALDDTRAERDAMAEQVEQARAALDAHAADLRAVSEARDLVVADWEAMARTTRVLHRHLDDEQRAREAAEQALVELRAELAGRRNHGADEADGRWMLLLAHIARRWAAVVGVPPGSRTITLGAPATQFAEALAREVERIREEMGVAVELAVDTPAEPADPLASLLAVIDLLEALAHGSERVSVGVGRTVELCGAGWSGSEEDLAAARARAASAGVAVGEAAVHGDRVQLIVAVADTAEAEPGAAR